MKNKKLSLPMGIAAFTVATMASVTFAAYFTSEVEITTDTQYRYIIGNGLPDHETGEFPNSGNPNTISEQSISYKVPLNPEYTGNATNVRTSGVAVNGIKIEPGTAEAWNNDRSSGWSLEAFQDTRDLGLDWSNAHVQPGGTYHYHGQPEGIVNLSTSNEDLILVGYAADGFEMYVSQGENYSPSYALKSGTRPDGPMGTYDGTYTQDFEFIENSGDLDKCNGTEINGEYVYLITESFPYAPRCMMGTVVDSGFGTMGAGGPGSSGEGQTGGMGGQNQTGGQSSQQMGRPNFDVIFDSINLDKPENWENMTKEEHAQYFGDNGYDLKELMGNSTSEDMDEDHVRTDRRENDEETSASENKTNKTRKASRYTKFTGELKTKKTFTDQSEITNSDAVTLLQQRGIIDGNGDGSFAPDRGVNRAESVKMILESLDIEPKSNQSSEFRDTLKGAWYTGYIAKAKEERIVDGYRDGTFQPGKTVNQAELLKITYEAFGIDLSDYTVSMQYSNEWYGVYIQYALDNNLIDSATPAQDVTREEFAEVLYRLITQQEAL